MRIAYSERLRSNYLVLEAGEATTVDHVLQTAKMHRAARSCCGGRVKVAIARINSDGTQATERFVGSRQLSRWVT